MFRFLLLFSDPELGQVRPSGDELGVIDVIVLLIIAGTVAGIILETYPIRRRRG